MLEEERVERERQDSERKKHEFVLMQAKLLEEEEKRFDASPRAMQQQNTDSSEEGRGTTFADLMGDTKQLDVPTMEDLLGAAGAPNFGGLEKEAEESK